MVTNGKIDHKEVEEKSVGSESLIQPTYNTCHHQSVGDLKSCFHLSPL